MAEDLGWKTEAQYKTTEDENGHREYVEVNGVEQVAFLRWGQVTGRQVDSFVGYEFFDTEKEAAQAFLNDIKAHPEARYRDYDKRDALKAIGQ